MQIFRELWTKESVDSQVHTMYEYVVNLRDGLESNVTWPMRICRICTRSISIITTGS